MTDTFGRQGLLRRWGVRWGPPRKKGKELKDIPVATVRKEGCAKVKEYLRHETGLGCNVNKEQ